MTARAPIDMMGKPRWLALVMWRYLVNGGMPRYENYPAHLRHSIRTDPTVNAVMRRGSLSWEDIKIFRNMWPGISMVKGIKFEPSNVILTTHRLGGAHGCTR
jgi:hypothetical protein